MRWKDLKVLSEGFQLGFIFTHSAIYLTKHCIFCKLFCKLCFSVFYLGVVYANGTPHNFPNRSDYSIIWMFLNTLSNDNSIFSSKIKTPLLLKCTFHGLNAVLHNNLELCIWSKPPFLFATKILLSLAVFVPKQPVIWLGVTDRLSVKIGEKHHLHHHL